MPLLTALAWRRCVRRKDTGEIIGVHLMGLHAADLIHEASNAMCTKQRIQVRLLGRGSPAPWGKGGGCSWQGEGIFAQSGLLGNSRAGLRYETLLPWLPRMRLGRDSIVSTKPYWQRRAATANTEEAWACCTLCSVQDIKFNVHAHPTVSEVIEILVHQAHLEKPKAGQAKSAAKQAVAA